MNDQNVERGHFKHLLHLSSWQGAIGAILLFAVLLTILYPEAILQGKVFISPDSLAPLGFASYVQEHELDVARWNPFIFNGMPAFASLSYNPGLYPVSLLIRFVIDHLGAQPLTWLLFHYLWAGLGIFLLLRNRRVRGWLAWLAGAWFILLPAQVAIGAYGHGSKVMTLAWIPWVLLFCDRLVGGRRLLLDAGLLALCISCLLLTAHVQVVYYGLMTLGLFALFRLVQAGMSKGGGQVVKPLLFGVLAILLAVSTAVLLYGPVQEYSHHSIRGVGEGGGAAYEYATAWSLSPTEWITFLIPSSRGFGEESYFGKMPMTNYPNYLGVLPFLAAILLFWRGPRRPFDIFFAALLLFATIVAAGKYLPILYKPLYDLLPWFNRFRVPVMILLLQQLALAVLLARGLERALRDGAALKGMRQLTIIGIVFLLLVMVIGPGQVESAARSGLTERYGAQLARAPQPQARAFVNGLAEQAAEWVRGETLRSGMLLLLLLGALEFLRRRGDHRLAVPLVLLTAGLALLVDMLPLDKKILNPSAHWQQRANVQLWGREQTPAQQLPRNTLNFLNQNLENQRFYGLPGSRFQGNEAAAEGLANFGGYHAAKLALADSVLKALPQGGVELLSRFAVRYLVAPQAGNFGPDFRLADSGEEFVFENTRARPRLFVANRKIVVEDVVRSRKRLLEGKATEDVLYLDGDPGFPPVVADQGDYAAPGSIAAVEWGLESVSCEVDLEQPAVIVLADMIYPGWCVDIDGAAANLMTADGFFRAASLPAGSHTVNFRFNPSGMERYMLWRWLGYGGILLLLLGGAFQARRQKGLSDIAA
ncbi:MAG: hypothetical protein GY835_20750 [bacterium]|nr:hypothetical protein [bacterium]